MNQVPVFELLAINMDYCDNTTHALIAGICSESEDDDEDSAPLMILEYMPYGDLRSFLENHKYAWPSSHMYK